MRRHRGLGRHPLIEEARSARQTLAALTARGVANPYFVPHRGISGPTIDMLGRELINFSTANYLGLAYHPHVVAAAKEAIGPVRNVGAGGPRGIRQVLMNAAIPALPSVCPMFPLIPVKKILTPAARSGRN